MAWTKQQIISQAFSEIGKGDYEFDLQPDVLQSALRQLDAMMATFGGGFGAKIGYGGGDGMGDLSASSDVPDWAVEFLYLNLAIRLAPSFGKTASQHTLLAAKAAYNAILLRSMKPRPRTLTGYAGAGSASPNLPRPEPELVTETNNLLEFGT